MPGREFPGPAAGREGAVRAEPHTEGESNASPFRAQWRSKRAGFGSEALVERDARAFLHQSLSTPCVSAISKAEGIWIEDVDGRRYMDFHGNSVHHVGYGHPKVIEAIKSQLDELPFSPRRFTNEPAVMLAEKLAAAAPVGLSKCLFTTGGSDAVEVAIKLARAATGRFKTVSFWDSFHGAGLGASSVGGEATFRSHIAGPLLPGSEHVAPFACTRCPYNHPGPESCGLACAEMVDYVLRKEADIAAVIAEPMRAVPQIAPSGYWRRVKEACDATGALLIFDEIPTGLGKTGKFFAHEHEGAVPDIVVLGKALGGGVLPIAAAIARPDLDVCGEFAIGHYTHEKNPVTARAALATIGIIEEEGLAERAAELGRSALDRLREFECSQAVVRDVRGRGLLIGVEIDAGTGIEDSCKLAEQIHYACLDAGLSFKVSQGSVLTLSPPLTISRSDLDSALGILENATATVSGS